MKPQELLQEIKVSLLATLALVVILCGVYPLVVWGIAQVVFPNQANGSLVEVRGKIVGSGVLAQNFSGPQYFHPRPSAAGDVGYDGGQFRRQQPGTSVPEAHRSGQGARGKISHRE